MTADEQETARLAMIRVIDAPHDAATTVLLALFVGLSVGRGLGMSGHVEGTELDRDAALDVIGRELDRRIPIPVRSGL